MSLGCYADPLKLTYRMFLIPLHRLNQEGKLPVAYEKAGSMRTGEPVSNEKITGSSR